MSMTKQNKYKVLPKAERTYNGIVFHSKAEMTRYATLLQWKLAGQVRNIRRQVAFDLAFAHPAVGTIAVKGKNNRCLQYVADFVYERKEQLTQMSHGYDKEVWREVIEDVKGMKGVGAFKIAVFEALTGATVNIVRVASSPKKRWKPRAK